MKSENQIITPPQVEGADPRDVVMGSGPVLSAVVEVLTRLNLGVVLFDESRSCRFCSRFVIDAIGAVPNSEVDFLTRISAADEVKFEIQHLIESAGAESETIVIPHPLSRNDNRKLRLTVFKTGGDKGELVAVTFQDVSENNKDLESIEHLNRLASVGQVAAGVAHEFNNNLTSVLGWTQIAQKSTDKTTPAFTALENIEGNARKAKRIFSRLLSMSRSDKEEDAVQEASPLSVVEEILELLSFELDTDSIEVVRSFEEVGTCHLDEDALGQVLVNIIRNAVDAMGKEGTICVGITSTNGTVRISIKDSGPGIPPHLLSKVFDSFFTTKSRRDSELHGGTGLGLSVSREIIRRFGGDIEVDSPPGEGACFTVVLPIAKQIKQSEAPLRQSRPTIPPGATVLVVDDGPDVGEMIRTSLGLKGVSVIAVRTGEAALDYLKKMPFDAAFVDYTMPGLSGHALGREMLAIRPEIPLIFMSGLTVDIDDVVTDFIKKPFDLDEIQDKLYQVLKRRKEQGI